MWEIPAKKRFNKWRSNSAFNENGDSREHMSLPPAPLKLQADVPQGPINNDVLSPKRL